MRATMKVVDTRNIVGEKGTYFNIKELFEVLCGYLMLVQLWIFYQTLFLMKKSLLFWHNKEKKLILSIDSSELVTLISKDTTSSMLKSWKMNSLNHLLTTLNLCLMLRIVLTSMSEINLNGLIQEFLRELSLSLSLKLSQELTR